MQPRTFPCAHAALWRSQNWEDRRLCHWQDTFHIPSPSSLCGTHVMLRNLTEALQLKMSVVHFDEKHEEQVTKPQCYDLNVCVPPNSYAEILIAKNDTIRREGLTNACFFKREHQSPLPLPSHEDTVSRRRLWTRRRVLTRMWWRWRFDLSLLSLQSYKK